MKKTTPRIKPSSTFARLLRERVASFRTENGDSFEMESQHSADGHQQTKYTANGRGVEAARAFSVVTGEAPRVEDIATLNDGIKCAIDFIRVIVATSDRDKGTDLEGSIASDLVLAFGAGVLLELVKSSQTELPSHGAMELARRYMEAGREWQRATNAVLASGARMGRPGFVDVCRDGAVMLAGEHGQNVTFAEASAIVSAIERAAAGQSSGDA